MQVAFREEGTGDEEHETDAPDRGAVAGVDHGLGGHADTGCHAEAERPARTFTPGRFSGQFRGGQVVSMGSGKLSIRSFAGQTITYTLAKSVTVTKTVRTTRSALRLGETVRVAARPGTTTAFAVTILS